MENKILAVNIVSTSTLQQAEIEELQKATSKDTELQCLKTVISTSWPSSRSSCSDVFKNYWNYRDELWIENGILMKNQKVIIPNVLRSTLDIRELIHASREQGNTFSGMDTLMTLKKLLRNVDYAKRMLPAQGFITVMSVIFLLTPDTL